jgi:hypothetical protein
MDAVVESIALVMAGKRQDSTESCLFFRTSLIPAEHAPDLQGAIAKQLGPNIDVDVCPSFADDAVLRRNKTADSYRLFLVIWDESHAKHAMNSASLAAASADLGVRDIASYTNEFPSETSVRELTKRLASSPQEGIDWAELWKSWFRALRDLVGAGTVDLGSYLRYVEGLATFPGDSLFEFQRMWGASLSVLGGFRFDEWFDLLTLTSPKKAAQKKKGGSAQAKLRAELNVMFDAIQKTEDLESAANRGFNFPVAKRDAEEGAKSALMKYVATGERKFLLDVPWAVDVSHDHYGLRYSFVGEVRRVREDELALGATISFLNFIEQEVIEAEYSSKRSNLEYQSWLLQVLEFGKSASLSRVDIDAVLKAVGIEVGEIVTERLEGFVDRPDRISLARDLATFWRPKVARTTSIRSGRLLEGLVQTLVTRGLADEPTPLTLRSEVDGRSITCSLDADDPSAGIADKLRQFVVGLRTALDAAAAIDSDAVEIGASTQSIREVKVVVLRKRTLLSEIRFDSGVLGWDDIAMDSIPSYFSNGQKTRALSLPQRIVDAWCSFAADGRASLGAPLGPSALHWVAEWRSLVDLAGQRTKDERILALTKEFAEPGADLADIGRRIAEVQASSDASAGVEAGVADSLVQLCSIEEERSVRLLRSHPIAVELRLAREHFLLEGVRQWIAGGTSTGREWFEEFADWVRAGVAESDFPVPTASYCVGPDRVLAFATWTKDGAAEFRELGGRSGSLFAIRETREFLREFQELHTLSSPSNGFGGDRLRVNFGGDAGGEWCLTLLEETLSAVARGGGRFSISAGLTSSVGGGLFDPVLSEMPALGHAMRGGENWGPDVEVGGEVLEDSHLLVQRGDFAGFQHAHLANLSRSAFPFPSNANASRFGNLLFSVNAETLNTSEHLVEFCRPADARALAFQELLSRVSGRQPLQLVFRFHPDLVRGPVARLHGLGRWVYLASPFRAHLAISAVADSGSRGVSLVDAWSSQASSGQVFECLSTVVERDSIESFAGSDGFERVDIHQLVSVARVIAPRKARTLFSLRRDDSEFDKDFIGLVGLCLTYQHCTTLNPNRVYLSLDQHRKLLREKRGKRADLLEVGFEGDAVVLRVIESKASASKSFSHSSVADEGREQVIATTKRLNHLGVEHFMSPRFRQRLAMALTDFEFVAPECNLISGVISEIRKGINIDVASCSDGEVHVWALCDESAQGLTDFGDAGTGEVQPKVVVHGFADTGVTLARLGEIRG